ncbi:hypothetical protein GE061_006261 [Apolygus lucorum]|uniref:Uncharacterized protein n=1 Tax=Apolygus lucorum TaxID=248454 RepID=A0A6A4J2M9_APOLU|nr:hypothetical protein GE061_006261 [Apolygus lucorum]
MQGDSTLRTNSCQDTIFEGKLGGVNLSEEDKRQYCDRLVEKVLEEYPDLCEKDVMVRLGHIWREVPISTKPHLTPEGDCHMGDRNKQESSCDSRKMAYAETLIRQVMLENPHFEPSKVIAAVRELLNIVPEVDVEKDDGYVKNTDTSPSLAVELSQSDCRAHDTAFDIIMEEVLGTRNVCDDLEKSRNRVKKLIKDPCDDPKYKMTLYTALEKARQQKSSERKAQNEAERAQKLNSYLTDICRELDRDDEKRRKQKQRATKSSKSTFSERNLCNIDCDRWVGGDSEFSSVNIPTLRSYSDRHTQNVRSTGKAYLDNSYGKRNARFNKGKMKSDFWETNSCNVACDDWVTNGGISAGDFKFSVPPRIYTSTTAQYDPAYMARQFKTPNIAAYSKWNDRIPNCPPEENTRNVYPQASRTPFQYSNVASRRRTTFAEKNPCTIWDPFCSRRNVPGYGRPPPNYQQRKWYNMSPCYSYPKQRPYAQVKYPVINHY